MSLLFVAPIRVATRTPGHDQIPLYWWSALYADQADHLELFAGPPVHLFQYTTVTRAAASFEVNALQLVNGTMGGRDDIYPGKRQVLVGRRIGKGCSLRGIVYKRCFGKILLELAVPELRDQE